MVKVIKKDETREDFNGQKIIKAINKSADRVNVQLTEQQENKVVELVYDVIRNDEEIKVKDLHKLVELSLDEVNPKVAKSYRDYRNYKLDFVAILDEVYRKAQDIMHTGDKSNANTDSTLVTTKRCLVYNELNKELYNKFFLSAEEQQACKDGYIYIHDKSARRDTMNCFAQETRFITSKGVKSFKDFKDGDEVIVPTHTGEWKKAIVHSYGEQKLQEVVFKRCGKGEKKVICTKNHRWLLKDGSETTSLKKGDKLILTPNISQFEWDDLTQEQKKLWVYGFCMADGFTAQNSLNNWYSTIRLYGHKVEYIEMFEDAGFTVTYPNGLHGVPSVHIPNFRKETYNPYEIRYEDVKYFVTGYLNADGNRNLTYSSNSPYRGVQVTGENNKFMYDLLNISGNFVTRVKDLTNSSTNYGKRTDLTLSYGTYSDQGTRGWVVQNIKETTREEEVWCLEVEDNHSFILENGIVTGNCSLFDVASVMSGGFEMGNLWYNEPNSVDVACDVLGDIIMMSASMQYGGWSTRVDTLLAPYVEKSYNNYLKEYEDIEKSVLEGVVDLWGYKRSNRAEEYAMKKVRRELEQGIQGLEYKLNSVASSRGDYPFTTFAFGIGTSKWEKMVSETVLKVRMNGQGKKGKKKPVLFPKLVFLYDENLHGKGKELEDLFDLGIECSSKAMYPDWLSLTGDYGHVSRIYKETGKVIYPMGQQLVA